MGRKIEIRASYKDDAMFFLRLQTAVELDKDRPIKWRKVVIGHLQDLSTLFLEADRSRLARNESQAPVQQSRKRKRKAI